ncbi:MAG: hypothetical protein GWN99_18485 [Gemmatimonadetes bacterium]|uniref:Uncharacterized protein n=1 Tax=Candidatus Kutchimonas denitrificans TaxID=3056748 RepID=A0AAE4ZAU7_9BACT|nr:hypothetical protein [Gemmatimonadota bacterium]NIR74035.1 hypothetical protein [Candidatus Kutchimonas denitrificans]NIS03024.1 hypothetical protein [Gemmatimonadota bacterium]NIT68741.1 hypothetical protein [Gemmatimonadota bacterium]NIU53322.1 hypothetical protein [Gemmatimonadota bacterium]
MSYTAALSACCLTGFAVLSPPAAAAQQTLVGLLREQADFSSSDLRQLAEGETVVKLPDAADDREIVVLGVVRVAVPADFAIDRLRHIETVIAGGHVAQQIGRFSEEPGFDDMAGFSLPRGDVRALRECRPGDCDVKLPADAMEQVRAAVDWSRSDVQRQASRVMRRWLLDYLNRYRRSGDSALATYDDKDEPLSVGEGFHMLLRESPILLEYTPELHEYLDRFTEIELEGAESFFYWSVEDFGLKPVTHLYHTIIYQPRGAAISDALLARKQIYASHYFQAAVTFISVADAGEGNIYLTMLSRKRFDGKVGGLQRALLERRLKDNARVQLRDVQLRLQDSYLAERGAG